MPPAARNSASFSATVTSVWSPRRCRLVEPAQEACHGDAVALLGGTGAFLLDRVLARLGQHARILGRNDLRACGSKHGANLLRRPIGIDLDARLLLAESR